MLDVVDAVEGTLASDLVEPDRFVGARVVVDRGLAGDSWAMADTGRSGSLPAAFAFRCSAIISRRAFLLATPVVRAAGATLAVCVLCKAAFGLLVSRSRAVFDFASSVAEMAAAFSGHVFAKVQ